MITSRYLNHLPATFVAGDPTDPTADATFAGRFLLAFERILTGLVEKTTLTAAAASGATKVDVQSTAAFPDSGIFTIDAGGTAQEDVAYTVADADTFNLGAPLTKAHVGGASVRLKTPIGLEPLPAGIETLLDKIQVFFDPGPGLTVDSNEPPARAPDGFLPWLAGWVATSLRDDWPTETKRAFIRRIASLYRKRGTISSVKTMLQLYLGNGDETKFKDVTINDAPNTPHYFVVSFRAPTGDHAKELALRYNIARAILDQEKPAHTFYALAITYPSLRIKNNAFNDQTQTNGIWVGRNTVLGTLMLDNP